MQVQLGGHPNPNPNPLTPHPNPNHAQVQLGGVNIMGAPFQAVVLPGRTDARHSTAPRTDGRQGQNPPERCGASEGSKGKGNMVEKRNLGKQGRGEEGRTN